MTENPQLLAELRRASDYAAITAYLLRKVLPEIRSLDCGDGSGRTVAAEDIEQFRLYLADLEERYLGQVRDIVDQLGHVPEGCRIPGRIDSYLS